MENKPEPRVDVDLPIRVWGMNAEGRPFFQNASARDISKHGAKLSRIEHLLKPGDIVGVQLGDKKARFRVVWIIDGGDPQKIQAGVQILEGQQSPWEQELVQKQKDAAPPAQVTPAAQNKRRFPRHKVQFPVELLPEHSASQMRTTSTDISGRGCYVETLLPLPLGTALSITLWMESEKVTTSGIVKACDGGVGMGIEFTGLDEPTQERLQRFIETMDPEAAASGESASAS
jgi:hypothetical protein